MRITGKFRNFTFYFLLFTLQQCMLLAACGTTGIIRDRLPPPSQTSKGILFQYYSPSARTVTVAGEFNNWEHKPDQSRAIKLKKDEDGIWQATVEIPAGRYMYKYVIDYQTWILDPYNPYTIDDGTGNLNSLLIVK